MTNVADLERRFDDFPPSGIHYGGGSPKNRNLHIAVSRAMCARFDRAAKALGLSRSDAVREALATFCDRVLGARTEGGK